MKRHFDWLFKDFAGRRGGYVIGEVPNLPLGIFMVCIVLALVLYPGFFKSLAAVIAYGSLIWWSWLESRGGRSRFRRLLGYAGYVAAAGALLLRLGF